MQVNIYIKILQYLFMYYKYCLPLFNFHHFIIFFVIHHLWIYRVHKPPGVLRIRFNIRLFHILTFHPILMICQHLQDYYKTFRHVFSLNLRNDPRLSKDNFSVI